MNKGFDMKRSMMDNGYGGAVLSPRRLVFAEMERDTEEEECRG